MATVRQLLKESSGLGEGVSVRVHLNNLGSEIGGDPYPVPVEIVSIENLSLAEAQSTQITTSTVSDGIDKQAVAEQVDDQATSDQININTGSKCP